MYFVYNLVSLISNKVKLCAKYKELSITIEKTLKSTKKVLYERW